MVLEDKCFRDEKIQLKRIKGIGRRQGAGCSCRVEAVVCEQRLYQEEAES